MANEEHRTSSFVLATLLLAVLTACEPPAPLADRLLLPQLTPVFEGGLPSTITVANSGEAEVDPRQRHLLHTFNSRREAVVTFDGLSWKVHVPTRNRPVLQAMLAAVGVEESSGEMVVETGGREIYRTVVNPGPWQLHEIELEDLGDVELILRSDGNAPLAWADVVLTWPTPDRRPNIVLVSIDTLRSDHLSCYGYERQTSPRLDRLAAESVLFTRSFSTSTWTLPSTATLLTGLLPAQHNVRRRRDSLSAGAPTLARLLSDAGYRTVGFADGGYLGFGWGLSLGFQSYTSGAGGRARTDDVAAVVARASSWLRGNRFEPFFLFLHTYETHQPYRNREGFADPFLDGEQDGLQITSARPFELLASEPGNPAVWRRVEALYDGEIARADHYLGRFFDALRDRRFFERTSILVTSDHGEEFLEHGGVDHAAAKVFDENVGVPLILRLPGKAGGEVVTTPVTGIDVVPTLLELAGLAPSPELAGRSLLSLRRNAGERPVFIHGLSAARGRRQERFRLDGESRSLILERPKGVVKLYDRGLDPDMQRPLPAAGSPLANQLQTLLAWTSKRGQAFARLPSGAELLHIPPDSAITPISVWQGLEKRRIGPEERDVVLDGRAATLVFEVKEEGELTVRLRSSEGDLRSLVLRSERPAEGWSPMLGTPEILQALPTAQTRDSTAAVIDDVALRELRALGYL